MMHDVRCPGCGVLLFRADGGGTWVEILCKCRRMIAMDAAGEVSIKSTGREKQTRGPNQFERL